MGRVLIACEYSGRVRDEFIKAGHEALSCDLLPTEVDGPHYQGDVLDIINDDWDLMIAHPPCTRLANSGVRWLHERNLWDELDEACEFYKKLREAPVKRKCIENPVMHKHAKERLGRVKRQVVQPWWFGEETFKATGYELIGLPELKPTNKLTPPKAGTEDHKKWSWIHRCPPSPERWKIRSRTPQGIAKAMVEQWGFYANRN
jgi:hypothetical protein